MTLEDEREAQRIADLFGALANTRRVVILECLAEGERSVGDLAGCERLNPSTQANMSQHLAILRRAGLVEERREGNRIFYRVASPRIRDLVRAGGKVARERIEALL